MTSRRSFLTSLCLALLVAAAPAARAQVSLAPGGTAAQDFNTLASVGTSNTFVNNATLPGWYSTQTTYRASDGGGTVGSQYSYGTAGVAERALGSLASGSAMPVYGVRIRNSGATAITSLTVSYTGEQWRNSSNPAAQTLAFAYKVGATSITEAGYTPMTALDFVSPTTGGSAGALDGNAAANRRALSATITATVAAGDEIWLQWNDIDDTGNDHGFGVDDFSVTAAGGTDATVTQTLSDGGGYRLLSAPVNGVTIGDLAAVNLVQGIPAGTANTQQQYPAATPNIYTRYNGSTTQTAGSYTAPATVDAVVAPGRGFFWRFFDRDIAADPDPASQFGGGTSQSYVIPERQLSATGSANTASVSVTFGTATADRFYMIGNPFARALSASAITVPGGVQGDVFQAFNPNGNGYVLISRTPMGSTQTALAVWQGVFAQTVDPAAPTFAFDASAAVPATPPFVGRPAAAAGLALSLTGTTAAGAMTRDEAAIIRLAEDASAGWDALDASKLTPPGGVYALVAPVLTRDGAPHRVAVDALPLAEALVPLQVLATDAGTYTLAADMSSLPDGWTVTLRDLVEDRTGDLAAGYTFTTQATDWTDRFELALGRTAVAAEDAPAALALGLPAPNPASQRSTLALTVDAAQRVTATLVDALGRTVATVFDGSLAAGAEQTLRVDTSRLAPGAYVVRVQGETLAEARRLTVAR